MAKVKKLVLVTSKSHPLNKHFSKLAGRISKELKLELEVREEDYVYLTEHGETDELGLTWLPQLLAELEDGAVIKVLTQPNLTSQGKLDEEKDYNVAMGTLRPYLE